MTRPRPTSEIVEQADVLGWCFDHYCVQADEWISVATLKPDLTAANLRQQYGEIRNVSELIALDPSIDKIAAIREQIDPLGWRFETCSDQTEEWTELIDLDRDCTEDKLCQQHAPIRNLTPIGSVATVAQAVHEHEEKTPPEHVEATDGDRDAR